MAPEVSEQAKPLFFEALAELQNFLPENIGYGEWRKLSRIDLEDRYSRIYG